jgi:Mannosyltransferase (PIG-V)
MITRGSVFARGPREGSRAGASRISRWRLQPADWAALGIWLASRAVLLIVSLCYEYVTSRGSSSWLGLWQHWDWYRYLTIAEYGYTSGKGPAYDSNIVAFFPGFPLLLRAVHVVVRNWAASGLLVSLVASGVAVVALARLAQFEYESRHPGADPVSGGKAAQTAALLLVCAPAAVFLAAGYTESLFLAFAVPGWLAARRHHWVSAGVLIALACTIRINGLFAAAGVLVMFLMSRPGLRDWSRSPALLLPLAAAGAYMAYLKDITGDWLAWLHAEQQGWQRKLTNPITAWRASWNLAFGSGPGQVVAKGGVRFSRRLAGPGVPARPGLPNGPGRPPGRGQPGGGRVFTGAGGASPAKVNPGGPQGLAGIGPFDQWEFKLELLAAVIGVALVCWLAWRRRWAELVYVGISVFALVTSTVYMSIPREMLLWWPLWTGLAVWMARRTWVKVAYVAVGGSLMIGVALLFFSGQWAG